MLGVRRGVWRRYGLGMRHDPWRRKVLTKNIFAYGYHTSWADAMAHALAFSEARGVKWKVQKLKRPTIRYPAHVWVARRKR